MISRPVTGEYNPYYDRYIQLVQGDDVISVLTALRDSTYQFLTDLSADKAEYAYAEGKWTIKQVIGHILDAERVFAFRLLAIARGEQQDIPGFDENAYVDAADFNGRELAGLAAELKAVRESNLYLLRSLNDEEPKNIGSANGQPVSVRALVYIMAGHELHHLNIIRERYL